MENTIRMTGGELAAVYAGRKAVPVGRAAPAPRIPDPDLSVPDRGTTGPISIGDVMEPVRRIIAHPDRNRLMAEFFRRHR